MAIPLANKANTEPASGPYPYGNIKDDTGSNDGTAVDKINHADFHQFFARMLGISGIVPNNLPDNATNGFQYFDALKKIVAQEALVQGIETNVFAIWNPIFNIYGYSGVSMIDPASEIADVETAPPRYRKNATGEVRLTGCYNRVLALDANYGYSAGNWFLLFTFPLGYRPQRSATFHVNDQTWVKIAPNGQFSLFSYRSDAFSISLGGVPTWFAHH